MGRSGVGAASGASEPGGEGNDPPRRYRSNPGSFDQHAGNLAAGEPTRYKRKHPLPSLGDRFGELTVVGFGHPSQFIVVQCSCGADPHKVYDYNLRKGASTRCNVCAKKQANYWRKRYHGYADIVPEESHRVRLLNRISACITRCHNPNDAGYHSYGARGIFVHEPWRADRKEFLRYLTTLENWREADLELDRIDVDKGYEPGNLRFITKQLNQANRRKVRTMQARILELEQENADLRSRLLRAQESLHDFV